MLSATVPVRRPPPRDRAGRGELASGSIGTRSRIEQMPRLGTGRIEVNRVSLDGDTTWTDGPLESIEGGEMEDARTYNKRNELRSRSVADKDNPSTPMAVALSYDKNGNLTGDGETREYVHDAFGRMVRITKAGSSGSVVWAEYTYDGLGRRISEQLDTSNSLGAGTGDGEVDGYDDVFYLALDAAGRRVATYRDADTEAKEVFYRHPASVQGPLMQAGSLLMRERNDDLYSNPETWATDAGDWQGQRDQYCTDFSGNVIALVEVGGGIVEQYRYSSSGVPYGIPAGDLNGDGRVETGSTEPDYLVWASAKLVYDVRGDLDLDGDVDTDDEAILLSADKNITGRGILSVAGVRTIHGYGQCEVFGTGLHTLWGCGAGSGTVVDAGLSVTINAAAGILQPSMPGIPRTYRPLVPDRIIVPITPWTCPAGTALECWRPWRKRTIITIPYPPISIPIDIEVPVEPLWLNTGHCFFRFSDGTTVGWNAGCDPFDVNNPDDNNPSVLPISPNPDRDIYIPYDDFRLFNAIACCMMRGGSGFDPTKGYRGVGNNCQHFCNCVRDTYDQGDDCLFVPGVA